MVFKLVRTDTADPCKIQLPPGTHLFGRDKFLDCADKRVSRSHGHLEVSADIVTLKALHQNPCFYSRKGTEEIQILKQNETIDLNNGDRFGLLPDTFWYELLHCIISPDVGNGVTENVPCDAENRVENTLSTVADNDSQMEKTTPTHTNEDDLDTPIDFELNESIEGSGHNVSQSLIPEEAPAVEPPSIHDVPTQVPITDSLTQSYHVADNATSTAKRAHLDTENNCDVKKVKTEVEDKQPGTSDDNRQPSCSSTDSMKAEPPSPTKSPQPAQAPVLRERCYYGAQCYRRNPQHKSQFSHPLDPDWGGGPRGRSPRGAGCRKRDARHWRDHDHPPGTAPPSALGRNRSPNSGSNSDDSREPSPSPAPKKKPRKAKRPSNSGSESESEDYPAPNLTVTGKRARKRVRRPSYAGSESDNEDPYETDDSDDWVPPSDCTTSQDYTQTQDL